MKMCMKLTWLLLLFVLTGTATAENPPVAQANVESMKARGLLLFCDVEHPASTLCVGYLKGWVGGLEDALVSDDKGILSTVVIEEGVTSDQMAKVFVLYMKNHPEEENKPAHVALMHAMLNANLVTLVSPGKDNGK